MLTRDFLMNADCKTAFGAIEESLLWSAEQRAASLAATLACRPDDGSVWIFWLRFAYLEPGAQLSRVLHRHAAGLAPRVLPAVDRRARKRLPAGTHAGSERGRPDYRRRLSSAGRHALEEELTLLWKR